VQDARVVEERRFGAIQALKAVTECLRESNPQAIFAAGAKDSTLDATQVQAINNRWANKAGDVLVNTLELADKIGLDALDLFEGVESRRGGEVGG
jgi:hypothetical protein